MLHRRVPHCQRTQLVEEAQARQRQGAVGPVAAPQGGVGRRQLVGGGQAWARLAQGGRQAWVAQSRLAWVGLLCGVCVRESVCVFACACECQCVLQCVQRTCSLCVCCACTHQGEVGQRLQLPRRRWVRQQQRQQAQQQQRCQRCQRLLQLPWTLLLSCWWS